MRISICIPTYNQAQYIEKAVRSAVEQTISPYEVIISNDCSTDNTSEILASLIKEYPILTVINQPVNLGMIKNTDACLRMAKGDYVIKLDSDDYLASQFAEKLSKALDVNPNAGYAHAAVQEIDQNNNLTKIRRLSRSSGYINGDYALKAAIKGYKVAANIIMFRREALEKVGFIQNPVNFAEDYFLSAAIAAAGYGNVYYNDILSYYRVWTDTGMVRQKRKLAEIMGLRSVFENVLEPAFNKRGWRKEIIYKKRIDFACAQANALGWPVYSDEEKQQLKKELYKLAYIHPLRFRLLVWLFENGYSNSVKQFYNMVNLPKRLAKALLK